MKKDKSTEMDDRYWEGISSLNEERKLKEQKNQSYFNGLDEIAKEEMKWDFEDFMETVNVSPTPKPSQRRSSMLIRLFAYGAAAVAILAVGFFFLRSKESTGEMFQSPAFSSVELVPQQIDTANRNVDTQRYAQLNTKKSWKNKGKLGLNKTEEITLPTVDPEKGAYVIVNGQPIYNEEEAEQIVLASLKIMTANFQEGKHALEKVKYIQVEL